MNNKCPKYEQNIYVVVITASLRYNFGFGMKLSLWRNYRTSGLNRVVLCHSVSPVSLTFVTNITINFRSFLLLANYRTCSYCTYNKLVECGASSGFIIPVLYKRTTFGTHATFQSLFTTSRSSYQFIDCKFSCTSPAVPDDHLYSPWSTMNTQATTKTAKNTFKSLWLTWNRKYDVGVIPYCYHTEFIKILHLCSVVVWERMYSSGKVYKNFD